MNSFSKFLNTDPKKYSTRTKTIIFILIMLPGIAFCSLLAVQTFIRGSEDLQDLTHVKGNITSNRIMKSKREGKYRTYYENVLVFSIQGSDDDFGVMEYNDCYLDFTKLIKDNKQLIAEIYYDKSRERIEENVTLHIFDLKINGVRHVKIEDIKKSELTGSLIFSIITIVLTLLTYLGAKRIKQKGLIA